MALTFKQRFGLMTAGIGAMMSVIALIMGTLDVPFLVASSVLVLAGVVMWFWGQNEQS